MCQLDEKVYQPCCDFRQIICSLERVFPDVGGNPKQKVCLLFIGQAMLSSLTEDFLWNVYGITHHSRQEFDTCPLLLRLVLPDSISCREGTSSDAQMEHRFWPIKHFCFARGTYTRLQSYTQCWENSWQPFHALSDNILAFEVGWRWSSAWERREAKAPNWKVILMKMNISQCHLRCSEAAGLAFFFFLHLFWFQCVSPKEHDKPI